MVFELFYLDILSVRKITSFIADKSDYGKILPCPTGTENFIWKVDEQKNYINPNWLLFKRFPIC